MGPVTRQVQYAHCQHHLEKLQGLMSTVNKDKVGCFCPIMLSGFGPDQSMLRHSYAKLSTS
jgi:hypothetical protein